MSRHKMTREEAIVILGKYLGCEKRIKRCLISCKKCKFDYDKFELRRAVEIAFKQLVDSEKEEVKRFIDSAVTTLFGEPIDVVQTGRKEE